MKKLILALLMMAGAVQLVGQGINYQGVLRNTDGSIMADEQVDVSFIILQGNNPVFSENHATTTDEYGVINLIIGSIDAPGFADIDWSQETTALEILIDGESAGLQDFSAVPFALTTTNMHFGDLIDVDVSNVQNGDVLVYNNSIWQTESLNDIDEQELTLSGTTLSISNGNSVNLSTITTGGDGWGNQTAETSNGVSGDGTNSDPLRLSSQGASTGEVLKWNGSSWEPGTDNFSPDTNTDEQTLALSGTTLSISDGNSVNLESITTGGDGWGNQSAETSNGISGDGTDNDPLRLSSQGASTGEVLKWNGSSWEPGSDNNTPDTDDQDLSLSGTTLSISNGNSVNLESITTGGDGWGSQVVQTDSELSGNGTNGSPLRLSSQGAANGQVLKWNGSDWVPSTDNNSPDTDDQTLALNGSTLSITNGNSINISGVNSDDQTLSINGSTLSISGGNSVALPTGGGNGDVTAVTAGFGLLGGGTSGSILIDADATNALWNANQIQGIPINISSPQFGQALVYNSSTNQFINAFQNDGDFFLNPNVPGWGSGLGALYPTNFLSGTEASLSNVSGHVIVGDILNDHIAIDGNELLAKSSADDAGDLYLQNGGGRVMIGSTSIFPTHLLHVNGVARSTQATWATSSDQRVKQNIEAIEGSLQKINNLRPVKYDWIAEYKKDHAALKDNNLGFIAQEVEEVIPEMISVQAEQVGEQTIADFRTMNMDPLFPHLVKAVQELSSQIDNQQTIFEKQEQQILTLTKMVNDLLEKEITVNNNPK